MSAPRRGLVYSNPICSEGLRGFQIRLFRPSSLRVSSAFLSEKSKNLACREFLLPREWTGEAQIRCIRRVYARSLVEQNEPVPFGQSHAVTRASFCAASSPSNHLQNRNPGPQMMIQRGQLLGVYARNNPQTVPASYCLVGYADFSVPGAPDGLLSLRKSVPLLEVPRKLLKTAHYTIRELCLRSQVRPGFRSRTHCNSPAAPHESSRIAARRRGPGGGRLSLARSGSGRPTKPRVLTPTQLGLAQPRNTGRNSSVIG